MNDWKTCFNHFNPFATQEKTASVYYSTPIIFILSNFFIFFIDILFVTTYFADMTTSDFAQKVLKIAPETLKKRTIFIKFIVADGKVVFDPELFVYFEKHYGEDSLYHKDIAGSHNIDLSRVQGGAFVGVGDGGVRITGYSTQFGGIEEYKDIVLTYFRDYFDCPVAMEV